MIDRDMKVEALAKLAGIKAETMSNQLAANFPSRRLRTVVEHVLKLPIWSTVDEFISRQALINRCGFDPFTITTGQLYQRLAALKIRGRAKCGRRREELIALLRTAFENRTIETTTESKTSPSNENCQINAA